MKTNDASQAGRTARTARLQEHSPTLGLEQLGRKLLDMMRSLGKPPAGLDVAVPPAARGSVLAELAAILGGGGAKPSGTMGTRVAPGTVLDLRKAAELDRYEQLAKDKPLADWTDGEIERARHVAHAVSSQLDGEAFDRHVAALPPGSVLHEDGDVASVVAKTPTHVEVRGDTYRNDIDDIAAFLGAQAKADGKTHAQEVNGSLISVGPGASAKAAVKEWEARRSGTPDQRSADKLLERFDREMRQRADRRHGARTDEVKARMEQQLRALPPGTEIYALQPDVLLREHPGIGVKQGPSLRDLDAIVAWLAKQATQKQQPIAYKLNNVMLCADPSKARGEDALIASMLKQWEKWA